MTWLVGALWLAASPAWAMDDVPSPDTRRPRVLVLVASETMTPSADPFLAGLRHRLQQAPSNPEVENRFLDLSRFAGAENDRKLADWLRSRYEDINVQVVVGAGMGGAQFLHDHGLSIWPEARQVLAAVPNDWVKATRPGGAFVVAIKYEHLASAAALCKLLPNVWQIALISGAHPRDKSSLARARHDLAHLESKPAIVDIAGLSWERAFERVGELPQGTLLAPLTFVSDAEGQPMASRDAIAALARHADRPMMTTQADGVGSGAIGGLVVDFALVGERTGQAAATALTNAAPVEAIIDQVESRWMFDARQLERWNIAESALPAGSLILFKEESGWRRFQTPLLVGLAILAVQAGVIGLLLVERRMRRRAEEQNDSILESMAADIAVLDRHGVVEHFNQGWRREADRLNPFVTATRAAPWLAVSPNVSPENQPDLVKLEDARDAVLAGHDGQPSVEYSWMAGDQRRWSLVQLRRLDRRDGVVVTHIDITDRKLAEKEAQRRLHELSHQNLRAGLGEMVATMAEEVTQPLTASLLNAQTLKQLIAGDCPRPVASQILDDIIEDHRRAADVVGRIRAVIQRDPGDRESLDLNVIVTDVLRILEPAAALDGVSIETDLDPALPTVRGDATALGQLVMNLVLNAMLGTAGRARSSPGVRIATAERDGTITLIVEDNGPGVDEQALLRVFEPIFAQPGAGLGLSISRAIAESHCGWIDAANREKGGARFCVTLPLDEPAEEPAEPAVH